MRDGTARGAKRLHNELQKLSQLKERAQKDDYLCEVLDAKTGSVLSALIIKSNNGSVHFLRGSANRNWAVMEAAGDQIMTYALPAGEGKGHFFGSRPVLSMSGLLAVDSEKREVTLYDLSTSEPRQQYTFAEPVACKAFSRDGKRLLVFTTDQTVYLLDTTTSSMPEPADPALGPSRGRLAFITPRFGDEVVGGSEAVMREAAAGLAGRGWEVDVLWAD